jgi:hypothetical protein
VLRVGGGTSKQTRVELRIDGKVFHEGHGLGNNFMHQVHFDLSADRGRSAQIAIVDDDPNGHILVDHVCLVDAVPGGS